MRPITKTEYEDMLPYEKVEAFIKQKHYYHFEGAEGVRRLENILRNTGYATGTFLGDYPILNFLADNPGAIEALLEFHKDHVREDMLEDLDVELVEEE